MSLCGESKNILNLYDIDANVIKTETLTSNTINSGNVTLSHDAKLTIGSIHNTEIYFNNDIVTHNPCTIIGNSIGNLNGNTLALINNDFQGNLSRGSSILFAGGYHDFGTNNIYSHAKIESYPRIGAFGGGMSISTWPDQTASQVAIDISSGGAVSLRELYVNNSLNLVSISKSGNGSIPLTNSLVELYSTATNAMTLGAGNSGQILNLIFVQDLGDIIVTVPNSIGFNTLTFNDIGDTCQLVYGNGGWYILSSSGIVIA